MNICGCFGPQSQKLQLKARQQFNDYKNKKKTLNLPNNILTYLQILQSISEEGYSKTESKITQRETIYISNNYYKRFAKFSHSQQHEYLLLLIFQTAGRLQTKGDFVIESTASNSPTSINEAKGDFHNTIQVKCKFQTDKTLGIIKNWQQILLKLNKTKKRLTVKQNKNLFQIPLRNYLVKSKKDQKTIIIKCDNQFQQGSMKKLAFKFNHTQSFQLLKLELLKIQITFQIDKLMMQNMFDNKFAKLQQNKTNKVHIYLNQTTINKLKNNIQIFIQQSQNAKFKQTILFQKQFFDQQSLKIVEFNNNNGTWYSTLIKIKDYHQPKTINFIQIYQNSHRFLTKLTILQAFTQNQNNQQAIAQKALISQKKKYCAMYQKLKINNKIYGQQVFLQKVRNSKENSQTFYFINLDHPYNQNFIQFISFNLRPFQQNSNKNQQNSNKNQHFMLEIIGKTTQKFNKKQNKDGVIEYFAQFYTIFERIKRKNMNNNLNLQQFEMDQINSKFYIQKDLISRFEQNDEYENRPLILSKKSIVTPYTTIMKKFSVDHVPINSYLKRKYEMNPTKQKVGKIMKQHFLYKQWQRLPKGGLKCINYDLVNYQKTLFKTVMKKFGQNLLRGRNIINFSLPVDCFKKQSHLQSLAQSMCFCPIYLQKAYKIKDPFERMKYSIIIMIAVGILTVQSQKPFNPILGQTYQGYVDGCPVYLQQLSHHPPISAYYMPGRGYKMYGCVQPRISIGLNSATGYSNLPHYIDFDDGAIIQLIFAKITITGMLFGDREFYFEDKIYAFDQKNNLFTELIFGPLKTGGLFSSSSEPQDYFHGKIYKISQKFKKKFLESTPRVYPEKQDIMQEQLMFDGIWSGSVHMDGQQIINFKQDLPYEFVEQEFPLASDSRYRIDLKRLIEGDKQQAQNQKQIMEDQQRKDKKLRSQYLNA